MKELIKIIKKIKPNHSFMIVADKNECEYILKELTEKLNIWRIDIKDTPKKSIMRFFEEKNIKFSKNSSLIELALLAAKKARENSKHLVISVNTFLTYRSLTSLKSALVVINNELTQNPQYSYKYYPIIFMCQKEYINDYKELIDEKMWRYRPYFPKTTFKVNVGLWIENYNCWKCHSDIEVLVGLKIDNNCLSLDELNEKFLDFLNKHFYEELKKIKLRKRNSFGGNIVNVCGKCGAVIGNFYTYDDLYIEQMPFGFKDVRLYGSKPILFDEVKKVIKKSSL